MRIGEYIVSLHDLRTYQVQIVEYARSENEPIKFVAKNRKGNQLMYKTEDKNKTWAYPIV